MNKIQLFNQKTRVIYLEFSATAVTFIRRLFWPVLTSVTLLTFGWRQNWVIHPRQSVAAPVFVEWWLVGHHWKNGARRRRKKSTFWPNTRVMTSTKGQQGHRRQNESKQSSDESNSGCWKFKVYNSCVWSKSWIFFVNNCCWMFLKISFPQRNLSKITNKTLRLNRMWRFLERENTTGLMEHRRYILNGTTLLWKYLE